MSHVLEIRKMPLLAILSEQVDFVSMEDTQMRHYPDQANHFNAAAWKDRTGTPHFLSRFVVHSAYADQPDVGQLVLFSGESRARNILYTPRSTDLHTLEDPRAVVLTSGLVALGMTAVNTKPDGNNTYHYYPALAYFDGSSLSKPEVITQFGTGKNMTPLAIPGEKHAWWMFRPEGEDHTLKVLHLTPEGISHTSNIQLPTDIPEFTYRAGTAGAPHWLTPSIALMPFHGMTIDKGKYIYSLGLGLLHKNSDTTFVFEASKKPLLTPDDFNQFRSENNILERHPHIRRAIYLCGSTLEGNTLDLPVNVGDMTTIHVQYKNLSTLMTKHFPEFNFPLAG